MKKLVFLTVAMVFLLANLKAQEAPTVILLNYNTLQKKVEKSNEDIVDEKKGAKTKTWVKRGELFQDVYNQGLEQIQVGLDKTMMTINYGDPESETTEDNITTYKYETINYLFEDGQLRGWSRNNPIHEAPLHEALASYKEAIKVTEADKKEKEAEKMKDELELLKDQFIKSGQNQYYLGNKRKALKDFEAVLKVNEFSVFDGVVDTLMINFCAIVAKDIGQAEDDIEMYRKSLDYYRKLAETGSGGATTYLQMDPIYKEIGDTIGALKSLERALKQYPDSSVLVALSAQTYYQMDENEKGIAMMDERIAAYPDEATGYFWKGLLISNKPEVSEDTIKIVLDLYETAHEKDPANGQILFQAGYVNYALGANKFELESYEEDEDLRQQYNADGIKYYEKAVEKLEKAFDLMPTDTALQKEALDLLKRIYYKLYGMEDERYINVQDRLNKI